MPGLHIVCGMICLSDTHTAVLKQTHMQGTHLGVAKVADLQAGCRVAIQQRVFQFEVPVADALRQASDCRTTMED